MPKLNLAQKFALNLKSEIPRNFVNLKLSPLNFGADSRLNFKICFDKFRKRKMTANELEKLRLSILDEAEQRKGTAFSIIALAVLASALWLFFNFRDQEAAIGLCWIIVVFSCGSISYRVVNKDANIVRVFIFCILLWILAKGVEMCENDALRFVIALRNRLSFFV